MLIYYWLIMVFVVGAIVGSFLNVAIARLPMEKSLIWPGSRCGNCLQAVRWYDNIPLISYWRLRGKCRSCGASFSIRYFLVELITALGFAGLYYGEMVLNIHDWPAPSPGLIERGIFPWSWWVGFAFHALLFSFLLVASVCDLDGREIPLRLTLTGTAVGLVGAVLFPWPWPHAPEAATPRPTPRVQKGLPFFVPHGLPAPIESERVWLFSRQELESDGGKGLRQGIYAWPPWPTTPGAWGWGPLPELIQPGGNWQTGLATGLMGMLVGTFMLRSIGFLFSKGLGKEALGLGDADLMMMAGAFLGWQQVVVAFFISVIPGLFFGLFQLIFRRDNSLPFGPSLAAGVMITFLGWGWLGPSLHATFFWPTMLVLLVVFAALFMLGASVMLRLLRRGG